MALALRQSEELKPSLEHQGTAPSSEQIQNSLRYSLYDGFFYSLMVGLGETYFGAYAVFLGANNFQLAVLVSLPPFMAGLSQFFTLKLLKKFETRRKMVATMAFVQACFLLPLLGAYFIEGIKLEYCIALVVMYTVSGLVIGPVWNSWIGDLVAPQQRGSYFGKRNRMVTVGTFVSMLLGGFLLRQFTSSNLEYYGFACVFILAFLARLGSVFFLSRKAEPAFESMNGDLDQFFVFIKNIFSRNEGRLILYMASVNFAVYMSAAYCTPYLLKNLKFSYSTFVSIISAVALAKMMSSTFWGEICDNLGPKKVVAWTGLLLPFSILPWAFTKDAGLLFMYQLFSGFIWSGYELSTFTFLLDAVKPSERARVASYSSIICTSAALVGGMVGAFIVMQPLSFGHEFSLVFIGSSFVRLVAYMLFVPRINEVRIVAPVKASSVILKATGFRPALGFTSRLIIFRRKK
ncbi:MAG: MFS transporter [Bdellovibrionales bacterium]